MNNWFGGKHILRIRNVFLNKGKFLQNTSSLLPSGSPQSQAKISGPHGCNVHRKQFVCASVMEPCAAVTISELKLGLLALDHMLCAVRLLPRVPVKPHNSTLALLRSTLEDEFKSQISKVQAKAGKDPRKDLNKQSVSTVTQDRSEG